MKHHHYTARVADTTTAAAFMRALVAWAQRHHADGMISVPSGRADIAELVKVVLALVSINKLKHRGGN
jgi:hypothetical protein